MTNTVIILTLISLTLVGCAPPGEGPNLQGIEYAESGDYQQALEYFDEAIQLDPNNAEYFNNRGNTYSFLKQYESAKEDYTQAIRLAPDYYLPYLGLGNVYDDLGEPEQAIEKYGQAIELEPDNVQPYRNRGATLMHMREFKQALPDLDRAIELNSNYVLAYISRSVTHAALNQYDEATLDYARATALDPERAFPITKVGIFKPINVAPDLTVNISLFGTWQSDDKSGETFTQTGRVPLIKGQSYGWFLALNTSRGTVTFREEFRLPDAPETWDAAETDLISEERQMMITEEEVQPDKDNVIGHSWSVAEGDPEGLYIMNIFVEDEPVETFIFWVGK